MKSYNFASIDVGSNSINLLLAKVFEGEIIDSRTESYITKLGQGLRDTGKFSNEGMNRAFDAFRDIFYWIKKCSIPTSNIVCVATEASRVAKNSAEFYHKVKEDYGITTEIISPDKEAKLSALGVISRNTNETYILDIGGASSELIHFSTGEIKEFRSFKIGSVNTSKTFDYKQVDSFVSHLKNVKNIILVGGTAATLGLFYTTDHKFEEEEINRLELDISKITEVKNKISKLSEDELVSLYPFSAKRKDSLQNGVKIICEFLNSVKPETIRISTRGVRQGALIEKLARLGQL